MDYLYVKMFDKGFLNDKVWLASDEKPEKFLIEKLALQYDESSLIVGINPGLFSSISCNIAPQPLHFL